MKDPRALYLVAAPGRWRDEATDTLAAPGERIFDRPADLLPLEGRPAGVVVMNPEGLPLDEVARVVIACLEAGPMWIPALVPRDGEGGEVVPLGPGYRYRLDDLARMAEPDGGGVLLLPDVVERVRATRHDINNPLAAALAEAQLLRMDAEEADLVEALDAILEQLRRIKDLVASLHGVRPPPRTRPADVPAGRPGDAPPRG